MPTFYIDEQSIGNENPTSPCRAKLTIAFRPETSSGHSAPTRIITDEIGDRTNNEAEYDALLRLLRLLQAHKPKEDVRIYSDATLLVNQISGEWQVKEERLRKLRDEAKELMKELGRAQLEWVPREKNLAGLWLERKIEGREMMPEEFLSGL